MTVFDIFDVSSDDFSTELCNNHPQLHGLMCVSFCFTVNSAKFSENRPHFCIRLRLFDNWLRQV